MKKQLIKLGCQTQPTLHLLGDVPWPLGHGGGAGGCGEHTRVQGPSSGFVCFSLLWDYWSFNAVRFLGLRLFPELLCISISYCAHIKAQPEEGFRLDKNFFAFSSVYFFICTAF